MKDWQIRGKECSPEETVQKVQGILRSLDLKTNMVDMDEDVENLFSCRISLDGPVGDVFGSNGKGMTKELSHASAHGELMERLSNRMFLQSPRYDDPRRIEFVGAVGKLQDIRAKDLPEAVANLKKKIADSINAKNVLVPREYMVDMVLEGISPDAHKGRFIAYPYYSHKKDCFEYFPEWMLLFTGSNGMAAGNTLEEAIVEGLSEIMERHAQMALYEGKIIPPEIPRDYLKTFPHIYQIIENIESRGHYAVRVLDCSLGKGLPAVCGVIIDLETGKFSAKFGAQPHMAIALERVFTESMQGSALQATANRSYADFCMSSEKSRLNKWNSMKSTSSNVPAQFLMDDPSYPFRPWDNMDGMSNREIMLSLIQKIESFGSDVYIRDVSYLGFPAVHIIATDFSEVLPLDLTELKQKKLSIDVSKYFARIENLTDAEVREMALFAYIKSGSFFENTLPVMSMMSYTEPSLFAPFDCDVLRAACCYRLGDYNTAAAIFSRLNDMKDYLSEKDRLLIGAVMTWSNGMKDGINPEQIYQVVKRLYPNQAEKVRDMLGDPKRVLEKIYPVIKVKSLKGLEEAGSAYEDMYRIYKKLIDIENNNPVDPENIRSLFRS
ncbi:MAG: YcaO-like family protein [Lachnospiraceae bacterium]|nr:YcaO-like family protein [Lachnospiraceae bacterium]